MRTPTDKTLNKYVCESSDKVRVGELYVLPRTLAVVPMAPAIFICEFMSLVWVDMDVTLELTAYVLVFCFLSWTSCLARILHASLFPDLAIFFISISCSMEKRQYGYSTVPYIVFVTLGFSRRSYFLWQQLCFIPLIPYLMIIRLLIH